MKKYVVMTGSWYYPSAGLRDVKGSFDTIEEAKDKENIIERHDDDSWGLEDWSYIIDRDTWDVLFHWKNPGYMSEEQEESYTVPWITGPNPNDEEENE